MGFNFLKKLRQTWSKTWTPKGAQKHVYFRPRVEALEERVVPTTRIWSGGSIFTSNWSDGGNWQNGVPEEGDSVDFPADAKRRTNVVDINPDQLHPGDFVGLDTLHIEGGDYDIHGSTTIEVGDSVISDSGSNTIENELVVDGVQVTAGTLSVTGGITTTSFFDETTVDLVKTGAGTLSIASPIGDGRGDHTQVIERSFRTFVVQQGLVSLETGGDLRTDLHIENGGTVRLQLGGDQIFGTNHLSGGLLVHDLPHVTIDAGGVMDLNGHSEGLGVLTLAGGQIISTPGTGTLIIDADVTTTASTQNAIIGVTVDLGTTDRTFTVANGSAVNDLLITGRILGTGGLTKQGPGRLTLGSSVGNSYAGTTRVNEGDLSLSASDGSDAIRGDLIIGDGVGGTNADRVLSFGDEQISNNVNVRINSSGLWNLITHTETLGGLILAGGNVTSGIGLLKLPTGGVTCESAATVATISGRLSLKDVNNTLRGFNVPNSVSGTDLLVDAVIEDGALLKSGVGTMELTAANTYAGDTRVDAGQLVVNGTLSNSLVRLNGGSLSGGGTVKGITATSGAVAPGDGLGTLTSTANVAIQTGVTFQPQVIPLAPDPHDVLRVQGTVNLNSAALAVQAQFLPSVPPPIPVLLDDSNAGFTASSGFGFIPATVSSSGFVNNNVHSKVAGTGSEHATWTFQNLQPGSYRVSAEWGIGGAVRATDVPYTIFDGVIPVTSVRANQQITANDFSKFGFGWHTLGIVQITGTTLTVTMSDHASTGLVFADAILIEPRQDVIIDNDGTDPVVGTFANLPEGATVSAVAFGVVNGQVVQQTQLYTISYHANDGNDVGLTYITTATAAQNLLITPATIHEGQKVTLTGKLTDPDVGDFLTLTIDWGDGKTESHHPGTQPFAFEHRYAGHPPGRPQDTYKVHLTWFDQHNAGNSLDLTVAVHNGRPAASCGGKLPALDQPFLDPLTQVAIALLSSKHDKS